MATNTTNTTNTTTNTTNTWKVVRNPDYILRDRYGQDTELQGEEIVSSHSSIADAKSALEALQKQESETVEVTVRQDYISYPFVEVWERFRIDRS